MSGVLRQAMSGIFNVFSSIAIDKCEKQTNLFRTEENVHSSPRKADFCQCVLQLSQTFTLIKRQKKQLILRANGRYIWKVYRIFLYDIIEQHIKTVLPSYLLLQGLINSIIVHLRK